ncbi:glycosyltransferase family 90 protein [Pseudomassariella vexata]|uniref:Glycosyltransferase family 90 protein n=1 Tax=Pseudomassariella vexata TaxID=1141098 RepID=A0A1Y2DFQ2_9PEZI|nr:glycosyltransferase family 90 protein [Pseudomassariella vexata]ORY58088.1 glycosyltransferase family 90 protein [Pseudomassariella vexata]
MRWRSLLRYAVFASITSVVLTSVLLLRRPEGFLRDKAAGYFDYFWNQTPTHPIDRLITEAHAQHEKLLAGHRSHNISSAAERYRQRRGRHPPPGFDAWMQYALDHDAVVVEPFFDRIYHDVNPFWAQAPQITALRAASWYHVVRVRDGKAHGVGNTEHKVAWLKHWTDLVAEAAPHLPDVDMPINYMDESRLLVPWEDIDRYIKKEESGRSLPPKEKVIKTYIGLGDLDAVLNDTKPYDPAWVRPGKDSYWNLARAACAPTSPAREVKPIANFTEPPLFAEDWQPEFSYQGYVRNFTASMDACTQPHLRGMHGTFIEPISMSTSEELIPLFGGCKLPMNNEILIPGAMYLTDDPFYSGGDTHGPPWAEKLNGVVWRGVASGGRHKKENWSHFQRIRLVQMLNGTTVSAMEENNSRAPTFEMPPLGTYDIQRRRSGTLGTWLTQFADAGFNNLLCFPAGECAYVDPYFSEVESIPMAEQYRFKFMPDVDGNSFSARYRGFLLSTSLPIKSTIYAEWHDDRLVPWLHFAPMDNTFQDLYGILDYFTRDQKGDDSARFIAEMGREWAAKALRREDMLLYVWRLLLEFARVCDENRESLGFVDDL